MSNLDNGKSCATLMRVRHYRMYLLLFKSTLTLIYVALRFVEISDTYSTSVVRQKIDKP